MSVDSTKEHIKLETEMLRLYFILFLTDISGTIGLLGKTQPLNFTMELALFILGFTFAVTLLILILKTRNKINNLINNLNQ